MFFSTLSLSMVMMVLLFVLTGVAGIWSGYKGRKQAAIKEFWSSFKRTLIILPVAYLIVGVLREGMQFFARITLCNFLYGLSLGASFIFVFFAGLTIGEWLRSRR